MYFFVFVTIVTVLYLAYDSTKSFCKRHWKNFETNYPLQAWAITHPYTAYRMASEAHKIATATILKNKNKEKDQQPTLNTPIAISDFEITAVASFKIAKSLDYDLEYRAIDYTYHGAYFTLLTLSKDDPKNCVIREHLSKDTRSNILYDVVAAGANQPYLNAIGQCFGPAVEPPNPECLAHYLESIFPDVTTADVPTVVIKGTTQQWTLNLVLMQYDSDTDSDTDSGTDEK